MSKYTVYGLPGVYNASPLSLNDGDGVALAVTQLGQLIVVNADGSAIAGGAEYIDGGVPLAHPHGPTIEWSDGANWQTVSTAKPLPVSATITPSGTQDVNLTKVGGATFALGQQLAAASLPIVIPAAQITTLTPPAALTNYALETGGNLATIAGIVTSSRAAVNPISGQSGVQGGSGVVTALSQRVVLATDVALPTGSNVIGHVITDSGSVVNSTLSAETTKVIGTVNQGTSPWIISGAVTEATIDAALISQEATTSGVKGLIVFGAVTTAKPTYTTGKSDALSLDVNGLLRVSLADTPANTNKLLVTPDSVALPANQSVNVSQMNGVTVSMGSGIMGTGVQRVVIASDNDPLIVKQATAANLNATVVGTGTFVTQSTLQTQTDTVMVGGINIKEINAVTPLMGNGTTGTGSLRVTIASDNTAFAVNATLSAETTKVIGTARIIGNTGATLDSTVGAGTAPTNQQVVGAIYNSTEISPTTGQAFALQADAKGRLRNVIMDAAGNTRGANVNSGNQLTVTTIGDFFPASTGLIFNGFRITTNTTTTPISADAYLSSIAITSEVAGTTSKITVQSKNATPRILIDGLVTTAINTTPTVINFQTPILMSGGIDIVTSGAVAATVNVWLNYYS